MLQALIRISPKACMILSLLVFRSGSEKDGSSKS